MRVFAIASTLLLAAPGLDAQEYEPMHEYVMRMTQPSGSTEEKVGHTAAELHMSRWDRYQFEMPPAGFTAEVTDAEIEFDGDKVKGEHIVWFRNASAGPENQQVSRVDLTRSGGVPTPEFLLRVSGVDLPVPAGTVAFHARPHGSPGVTVEARIGEAVEVEIGDRTLRARQFIARTVDRRGSVTATYLLSPEIPFGVVSLTRDLERRGKVDLSIADIRELPVPKGIVAIADAGFGMAPPRGFARKETEGDEALRFENESGIYLSVATFDPGGKDVHEWYDAAKGEWPEEAIHRPVSFDSAHAGEPSCGYSLAAKRSSLRFVVRGGVGYRIEIGDGPVTRPERIRSYFLDWRWLKK